MGPLQRARRLAFLRTEIIEPRPLSPAERRKRADAYLAAMTEEPFWIRAWSTAMTWHLDKVERWDVDMLVTEAVSRRMRTERERHPSSRPSPRPRVQPQSETREDDPP